MGEIVDFFVERQFLGNEIWRYVCLLGGVLGGLVAGRLLRYVMERLAQRFKRGEERQLAGLFLDCLGRPVAMFCFVIGLRLGLSALTLKESVQDVATNTIDVLYALAAGYAVYRLVDIMDHYLTKWTALTETKVDDMLVPLVRKSVRITIVIVILIFVVNSFFGARQVATILAGMGVGGLAIALAAQDSIKNFFGSIMILLDKPFRVGDRVVFEGHDGPVETVGFRSTKIRTLDGHLVTIPNSELANHVVQNIGQRPYIRRRTSITITYDTPPEKVRRAVEILREILDNHEGMDPDLPPQVYFNEFNDASLGILMIYWFHPPSYWDYLAFSQKVNLEIFERFNAEGIEFAFPTQTIYLANDEKRQLALRLLGRDTEFGS